MLTNKGFWVSVGIVFGAMLAVWLAFSWFEAGKEIRALCGNFHPGWNKGDVVATLETGAYLQYEISATDDGEQIFVDSMYNVGSSNCTIMIVDDVVTSSTFDD